MWSASDKATGPVTVIAPPHRSLRRGGAGRGAHRQPLLHQVPLVPIGGDQGRPGERGGRRRQAAARAAPPLAPPLASPSPDAHSVAALVSLQYCWVHPEKEAAIQCILCLRCKVRPGGFHAPQHWLVYGARAAAACLHQGRAASKACTAKPRGGAAAARRPPIPPLQRPRCILQHDLQTRHACCASTTVDCACAFALIMQVDTKKSYHCSSECLREHWAFHRDFHQQSRENGGWAPAVGGGAAVLLLLSTGAAAAAAAAACLGRGAACCANAGRRAGCVPPLQRLPAQAAAQRCAMQGRGLEALQHKCGVQQDAAALRFGWLLWLAAAPSDKPVQCWKSQRQQRLRLQRAAGGDAWLVAAVLAAGVPPLGVPAMSGCLKVLCRSVPARDNSFPQEDAFEGSCSRALAACMYATVLYLRSPARRLQATTPSPVWTLSRAATPTATAARRGWRCVRGRSRRGTERRPVGAEAELAASRDRMRRGGWRWAQAKAATTARAAAAAAPAGGSRARRRRRRRRRSQQLALPGVLPCPRTAPPSVLLLLSPVRVCLGCRSRGSGCTRLGRTTWEPS